MLQHTHTLAHTVVSIIYVWPSNLHKKHAASRGKSKLPTCRQSFVVGHSIIVVVVVVDIHFVVIHVVVVLVVVVVVVVVAC